jgi:hypothetical protein
VPNLHLRVARGARGGGRAGRVGRMAARALCVGPGNRAHDRGQQGRLVAVAARARAHAARGEVVWLVTGETRFVSGRPGPFRLLVAGRAYDPRRERGRVRLVAIETIPAALVLGMRQRALGVTARARRGYDRWGLVHVVARLTVEGSVRAYRGDERLPLGMTADASWRGLPGLERVTEEAIGFLAAPPVGLPCLFRVALRAYRDVRPVEARCRRVVAIRIPDRAGYLPGPPPDGSPRRAAHRHRRDTTHRRPGRAALASRAGHRHDRS